MAQQLLLLSSFGKRGVDLGLPTMKVDIEDTTYLSRYFDVVEFNPIFTAGRNSFAFNGSPLLASGSEIKVQVIDSNGDPLFLESPKSNTQFTDVANFVLAVHVYNETYNGSGKVSLVGTASKGEIVRWMANISIDKTLQNISKTRFYNSPTIEARSLLYPVIANDVGSTLTQQIMFSGSFFSFAVNPPKDTLQSLINPKKINTDYRLIFNAPNTFVIGPQLYPTASFNSQMEGQPLFINTQTILAPFSYLDQNAVISASFTIKKVLDSKTLQLSNNFFFPVGKDQVVTNINLGGFTSSYKWVAYNTQSEAYQQFSPSSGSTIFIKQSYAEVIYRNIRPFTGFVARHKLYRKSLLYPGDFQLVVDEPLGIRELLVDPITANKSYSLMGVFYNQVHINRYWFTSSNDLQLSHSVSPRIDSMRIGRTTASFNQIDGTKYIIVKTDSINPIPNDATYFPYDPVQFNELQGASYNSNFIDLKSGSLYILSMNLTMEKDPYNTGAKIMFFFTSSIPDITKEKDFITPFGLKIGEITSSDITGFKNFPDKQMLFFIPKADYFGTLVVVPFQCSATLTALSLGVYGDYGFSPDSLSTKVPFAVNIANEGYQLKAELYDINSTLVFSNLNTIQSFDPNGESLFTFIQGSNFDPQKNTFVSGSFTISQSLFLPNNPSCPGANIRFLAFNLPQHSPPLKTDGQVCYTNISELSLVPTNNSGSIITKDYLNLTTVRFSGSSLVSDNGRAIAVHYSGSGVSLAGRRIFVDITGSKTIFQ